MTGGRRRTELEGAVLGVLWDRGPCTAYAVRREFLDSPSPYWSGSAGAIYPLLGRLRRFGLVTARSAATGRRPSRLYLLTPRGLRAFRQWLRPPWPALVAGVPADPIRTRVSFLGALAPAGRRLFLSEAVRATSPQLRLHEKDLARHVEAGNPYEAAVARGALAALGARREWLRESLRELSAVRGPKRRPKSQR